MVLCLVVSVSYAYARGGHVAGAVVMAEADGLRILWRTQLWWWRSGFHGGGFGGSLVDSWTFRW